MIEEEADRMTKKNFKFIISIGMIVGEMPGGEVK